MRPAVLWSLAGLALFFLLDGLLFHSGFYNSYVEPDSSAGEVEGHLHWFDEAPAHRREVGVVGDSRIAEGFSARVAASASKRRVHFTNFGIPGTTPRVWYYVLRNADPDRDRFNALVIALGQYSDQDLAEDSQNWPLDLNFLAGELTYADCLPFAQSYLNPARRRDALTGCLLRGIPFRADLRAFLLSPVARLRHASDWMAHGQGYLDGYNGKPEDVAGLTADFQARTIAYPPGLNRAQRDSIRTTVMPGPAPQTGRLTAYREQWLGAIVQFYRGSKTRIVFSELPRAPLPIPDPPTPARFLQHAASMPGVTVLPAATFRDLERPDIFADGLHLNSVGRPLYSARLSGVVSALPGVR